MAVLPNTVKAIPDYAQTWPGPVAGCQRITPVTDDSLSFVVYLDHCSHLTNRKRASAAEKQLNSYECQKHSLPASLRGSYMAKDKLLSLR